MENKNADNNLAFIDGQNLHLGTTKLAKSWTVDLKRFRIYLQQKYKVSKAYYYLGFTNDEHFSLYKHIQESGFILAFKPHKETLASNKKGNVDADIIFDAMEKMYKEKNSFDKIVLVSGDGDYMKLVEFLIGENKFKKVLFPSQKNASSLYKRITRKYFDDLNRQDTRQKIGKRKGGLR